MTKPELIAASPAVSMRNATKSFAGKVIIPGADMEVQRGGITIITGPSGSGKSTLLRMAGGIELPDSGEVEVLGQDISKMRSGKLAKFVSKNMGIGFQAPLLDRSLTVRDNIELTAAATKRAISAQRMAEVAFMFGIADKLGQRTGSLSGGEQQMVGLSRAHATNSELTLHDEPTAAIDPHGKERVFEAIAGIVSQGDSTVLMVTHDAEIARHYADHEIVVDSGHIVDTIDY